MGEWGRGFWQAAALASVGAAIGIGQLLLTGERLTRQIIIGRAISTGGMAMGAGAALVWFPALDPLAMLGLAAILASLGTSALERIFQRVLGKGETS